MTPERYNLLMIEENALELTKEEVEAGWHFCPEWDYLLVGPDWPEASVCSCYS